MAGALARNNGITSIILSTESETRYIGDSNLKHQSMEASRKLFAAALLLVLLLAATEELGGPVAVAEARTCESRSHRFRGPCVRRSNCANVCRTEGFPDGKCRGFRRRCFCTTHCHH